MNMFSEVPDAPRIVLIEDDPTIGLTTRVYFESEGFTVEWHQAGETGIQSVLENPPDIILLDLMMPGMDGYAVLEKLSQQGLVRQTVVMTALTQEKTRQFVENHGARFITKPFRFQELAELVHNISATTATES